MPSSRVNSVPTVINIVRQAKPDSILDVGVGFGKWGVLFREYTDIVAAEKEPERYRRENWRLRIDGVEAHEPYLSPLHDYVYDAVHPGEVQHVLPGLGVYDIVFLGDVIEHLEKDAGVALLRQCLEHARRFVLVTTPYIAVTQGALCGNEYERHCSAWTAEDFHAAGRCVTTVTEGNVLVAVLLREGEPAPALGPTRAQSFWVRVKNLVRPSR